MKKSYSKLLINFEPMELDTAVTASCKYVLNYTNESVYSSGSAACMGVKTTGAFGEEVILLTDSSAVCTIDSLVDNGVEVNAASNIFVS